MSADTHTSLFAPLSSTYSPSQDLDVLKAMARDLEMYLQSEIVYWQLSDAGPFTARNPSLTVGGLLLNLQRLSTLHVLLPSEEHTVYARVKNDLEGILDYWRANMERKAWSEIWVRMHSWERYLEDCAKRPRFCVTSYPTDVYGRTYLQLLFDVISNHSSTKRATSHMGYLDNQLRRIFVVDGFAWDAMLEPAFPKSKFWFLYGFLGSDPS